jgi:hypothetical protein
VTSLSSGVVYSFKATARNLIGNSGLSESVQILAAQIPDAPVNLANVEEQTSGD